MEYSIFTWKNKCKIELEDHAKLSAYWPWNQNHSQSWQMVASLSETILNPDENIWILNGLDHSHSKTRPFKIWFSFFHVHEMVFNTLKFMIAININWPSQFWSSLPPEQFEKIAGLDLSAEHIFYNGPNSILFANGFCWWGAGLTYLCHQFLQYFILY